MYSKDDSGNANNYIIILLLTVLVRKCVLKTFSFHEARSRILSYYVLDQRSSIEALNSLYVAIPVNTKQLYNICTMLDQRRRPWGDVVQMLYKCFLCLLG